MVVYQFEVLSGLEFRVYAASDRLKAELRTKLIHYLIDGAGLTHTSH